MLSVWCPNGYKVFPKYTEMHIGHLANTTMAQQDQEGDVTCIAYLSNIVKTMFYNVLRILFVSDGQLFFSRIKLHNTRRLGVGHGWCGHAAQVCSTMSVLVLSASP